MKYAVSISTFKSGQLSNMDIKIMKASDPTMLKDALYKIISLQKNRDYKKYTSSGMGLFWEHHNNRNSVDRGAFKIYEYLHDKEEYFVCYYRRIRETDTITIKEEADE